MKITGHRVRVARVPYDEGRAGIHFVLQLQTDEGVEGLSYVSRVGATAVKAFAEVLDDYARQAVGLDPLATEAMYAKWPRRSGALSGFQERAASALDVACWDIKGKVAGLPIYRLLGGDSNRVSAYASWKIEEQDSSSLARHAEEHVKNGFRAMKFHTRGKGLEATLAHLQTVREAVGDGIDVMVDNTQMWDVKEAIAIGQALAPLRPYWLEDAVPKEDYEGLRQVTEALPYRTCAGEGYRGIAPFRELLQHRGVDIVMVDLDLGLTGALKVAHLAEAYGRPIVPHLATEVLAHLIAAVPNGLTVEYIPWAEPLFQEVPRLGPDGKLALLDKPGLGLLVDEAGLRQFAFE